MWGMVVRELDERQVLYTPCDEWRRRTRHPIYQSVQIDRRGMIVLNEKGFRWLESACERCRLAAALGWGGVAELQKAWLQTQAVHCIGHFEEASLHTRLQTSMR